MHSNSTGLIFLIAVFVLGAILFALGTLLVRRGRRQDCFETIERLVMVGQPWCVDELRAILSKDSDPAVRDAADSALLVIASRGA